MHEHPTAAVLRRAYEARARGDTAALAALVDDAVVVEARTPLSISAVGDLAVVIDCVGFEVGVAVFRVVGGRVAAAQRLVPRPGPRPAAT